VQNEKTDKKESLFRSLQLSNDFVLGYCTTCCLMYQLEFVCGEHGLINPMPTEMKPS